MLKNKICWSLLSEKRSWLFSTAILLVVFFHFFDDMYLHNDLNNSVAKIIGRLGCSTIGSVGVDIFCLLSGIGLFFSYSKNTDIKYFYKKRAIRLLITYIPIGGLYWVIQDLVLKQNFITFLSDFTVFSFWMCGDRTVWFISYIALMYLCFPGIYHFLRGNNNSMKLFVLLGLILLGIFFYGIFFLYFI